MAGSGYSGTPLPQKLGIREGMRVLVINAPAPYAQVVQPLPPRVTASRRLRAPVDMIHLFARSAVDLARQLPRIRQTIAADGMIWVSWPKKASGVATDLTEDVIREISLPLGLVDVKVCAVDEVWSGLKLVIRKAERARLSQK